MKQMPEPSVTMDVYNVIFMGGRNGYPWRAVAYMRDDHGRKWAAELQLNTHPIMLAGERLLPHEIIED